MIHSHTSSPGSWGGVLSPSLSASPAQETVEGSEAAPQTPFLQTRQAQILYCPLQDIPSSPLTRSVVLLWSHSGNTTFFPNCGTLNWTWCSRWGCTSAEYSKICTSLVLFIINNIFYYLFSVFCFSGINEILIQVLMFKLIKDQEERLYTLL